MSYGVLMASKVGIANLCVTHVLPFLSIFVRDSRLIIINSALNVPNVGSWNNFFHGWRETKTAACKFRKMWTIKVATYLFQDVLLDVFAARRKGLRYIPEKPDKYWKGFMEELCVFLPTTHAPSPIACPNFYSLR